MKNPSISVDDEFWNDLIYPGEALLRRTREHWAKMLGKEITHEDAIEIHQNFFGLLKLLDELDRKRPDFEGLGMA